jgi:murein tripeptide amidase MpaA
MKIDWTRYLRHDEQTQFLRDLEAAYPDFARLASIGRSHQGRELWLMELTDRRTGPAEAKPAYYVDGNCHGEEVLGAQVALYTITTVLARHTEPWIADLLATRALYIVPSINPDGAEYSLTTPYHHVGNGRYLPWTFDPPTGLYPADVNDDGYILQMRFPDPAGEWKISTRDPRIMIRREPGETGGDYYRILPEGYINGYDGGDVVIPRPPHGNLNRQFPVFWAPERGEYGAGDYPLNEPEALAVARFILAHPNITGALAHHTHGGLILRPSSYRPDAELPPEDVWLFSELGAVGEKLTGYRLASIFEDFTKDKRYARNGGFGDWVYEQLGIPFLATELWDAERAAGVRHPEHFPTGGKREADQAALLAWSDKTLGGEGFIDWTPYDHPQLGQVEIGGWDEMFVIRNAPGAYVEEIARSVAEFTLRMAASSPLVRIVECAAEPLGARLFRVRAVVKNFGYLPTHLTQLGLESGDIAGVEATITPLGAELVMNAATQKLGHLDGMASRPATWSGWNPPWGVNARIAEWLVRADADRASVVVTAAAQKGGIDRRELRLEMAIESAQAEEEAVA